MKGMNSADIKRRNRGLFIKSIALNQANSRIALSRSTGLTKMTAGNIVLELLDSGIITEVETEPDGATGPTPQKLVIADTAPKVIGVYLSRDQLVVSVGDLCGTLSYSKAVPLEQETARTLKNKLLEEVKKAWEQCSNEIFAMGVASIGPIDKTGTINGSPNFFGIKQFPVKQLLEDCFEVPIVVYNDMSAAAIAERYLGNTDYNEFSYIGLTNGIGAGIINKGKLLTSGSAFVGELGHTTIDYSGDICPCGNVGCLGLYANLPVVCKQLEEIVGRPVTVKDFEELSENPSCDKVMRDAAIKLSAACVNLSNLVKPQAFIIGHDGYYVPDKYIELIKQRINGARFMGNDVEVEVMKSSLEDKAPIYGSVCCALKEVFDGKLIIGYTLK